MAESLPAWAEETKAILEPLIKKPKLNENLLKPPFAYIFQIVTGVISGTGFGNGLFTEDELAYDKDKFTANLKVAWLTKIIDFVGSQSGTTVAANAKKIVAGQEPENTNQFLQLLGKLAVANKQKPTKEEKPKDEKPKAKPKKEKTKEGSSKEATKEGSSKPATKEKKASSSSEEKKPKKESKEGAKKEKSSDVKKKEGTSKTKKDADSSSKKKKEGSSDGKKKSSKTKEKDAKEAPAKKPKAVSANPTQPTANEEKLPEVEPVEEDPEVKKVEKDLGTDQLIKQTTRPQTARPAPPRIQSNVRTVEKVEVEVANPVKQTRVVIEEGTQEEEEDAPLLDDDEKAETSTVQSSEGNQSSEEQQHGGLVRDIIAATKSLETPNEPVKEKQQQQKVEALTSKHNKEVLTKEVNVLRESIQVICRSANPLGKTMDYVQEDFENMSKELERWRQESSSQLLRVEEERRFTEQAMTPLHDKLSELDQAIKEILLKVNAAKANVEKNDETISKMLRLVVHHDPRR